MAKPDLDTVLATADAGLSLAERLARLFKRDPAARAARMLARAGRLNARSITANPKRAARLRAMPRPMPWRRRPALGQCPKPASAWSTPCAMRSRWISSMTR